MTSATAKANEREAIGQIHVNQIDLITAIFKHLDKRHKVKGALPRQYNAVIAAADLIVEEFAMGERPSREGMGLSAWLVSDDTGISSKFIVAAIQQGPGFRKQGKRAAHYGHPHDADDFGRCVRLLMAAPELREHLGVVAECSPEWAAFVENWKELESLYVDEKFHECSERISAMLKEIRSW